MSALAYATENNYDMLSKFGTVKEFNNHFEQAMLLYKKHFTKSEYIALNNLRKFAGSDVPGVAWCRLIKAVAATFKESDIAGVSRRTHERMLAKAKEINLITVLNQERANGSQKHNIYVFNRLEELVTPVSKKVEIVSKSNTIDVADPATIDAPISLLLYLPEIKRLKDINTYQPTAEPSVDKPTVINFEQEKTPRNELKALVTNLFSDAKIPNRLYGVWLAQTSKLFNKPSFDLAKQAVMILANEVRRRYEDGLKPLNNPVGYYNGILGNLIDKWVEAETNAFEENYEYDQSDDLAAEMDLAMQDNWLDNREDGPAWLFW